MHVCVGRWGYGTKHSCCCKDILEKTEAEHGKAGNEYAAALNNLALIYENTGRYF